MDAVTLIGLRMLFALPMFLVAAWWVERGPGATAESPWRRGDALRVAALGAIGYYLSSFLDFLGLQHISAGLERVILYLNPTLVMVISALWLGRRAKRHEWVALAIAYAGVCVVFWHDLGTSGGNVPLGATLVGASALCYALYLIASGALVTRLGPLRLTAWASIASCVACVAQALVVSPGALLAQPAPVYWLSVANAVLCTVLPVFLVMVAIDRVGSGPASQMGMLGPVSTIALAALLLDEPATAWQLAGTAIVLAGVAVLTLRR